ncbi:MULTISPECIES: tRNA (pseudouridine(54)-N(1))-methyltransferase TrmY [Halorubrum]|uniref:tRNA (pseudouridine(54)-N(1))-methyltransferase n=1 Tax=Halorubrum ezzemoulense TaxID=337243 RepID=A0A256K014_HALEZ|nr:MULTISPECIES: tRNA (pseudouridine(54)-N(1))-methyltransferase TrmY [Halorubrum]MDB2270542.1 tRNA (pseudouridine(54)-N(1))-methyltransferase TrmY [Halorubrum ezzemoulense]OYR74489.1 tRNA (pseudouridine(54)-N(1))-methyltransferase TrmY [Halorubrum ezzemoulense]OYR74854.1 tRNA (pseudouridine(54)-N(1))-methyltransferase TrmY [Halorubrum ezzemoulense]PHQ43842.1 tRNA (pseudouridine(54)-N(1))-methyltransferase TrmY [Halorubrum sp. C191]QAY20249.1 tRNA (pseudouridine(54)-N(1))-methyltransferase Trm
MRQFVVIGRDVPTDPDAISLSDIPGAGRLDLLCRCVSAGVFLSHGIRESVRVHLAIGDEFTVSFDSDALRHLHPDERNVAARVRDALDARDEAIGHMPADVSPGVELRRMGLDATLDRLVGADGRGPDGTLVQLHEDGAPLIDAEPPEDPVFVLSDHHDFAPDEAAAVDERADRRLRVGPELLHADHAITVVHNWLDTDGYASY